MPLGSTIGLGSNHPRTLSAVDADIVDPSYVRAYSDLSHSQDTRTMPLTLEQAINAREFHAGTCTCTIGPRGGRSYRVETWRRNGKTKLWKTRPNEFRIPVKWGMKVCDYITHGTWPFAEVHTAEDCPLRNIPADYAIPGTYTGLEDCFTSTNE